MYVCKQKKKRNESVKQIIKKNDNIHKSDLKQQNLETLKKFKINKN